MIEKPVEHVCDDGAFLRTVNALKLLIIFTEKLHRMCSTKLYLHLNTVICYRSKGLKRSFPSSLGLGEEILDSTLLQLLIPLINTKNKKMKSWTHPASSFLCLSNIRNEKTKHMQYGPFSSRYSFLVHDNSTKNYGPHWFISFICTRPFHQNIWSSFIYFFFYKQPFDQN